MNLHLRRAVVGFASFCLLAASTATLAQATTAAPVANKSNAPTTGPAATLVTTQEILDGDLKDNLRALLARDDVRAELLARGVAPADVAARVDALTDAETRELADRINQMPAGGDDVLGVLLVVFIILLVTDILCLTKVFPFTRCFQHTR
jgi:hypothetical protein